jgi:hypothetical protein
MGSVHMRMGADGGGLYLLAAPSGPPDPSANASLYLRDVHIVGNTARRGQ